MTRSQSGRRSTSASAGPGTAALVAELHRRQGTMYAGGPVEPVLELLAEDVVWHVPGKSPIAGDHRGREAVGRYFAKRRELAQATMRMFPGELLAEGDAVIQLVEGRAELGGEEVTWQTAGVYRIRDDRVREVWLVPLDLDLFDRLWTAASPGRPEMPPLHRSELSEDPIEQFRRWYERAERELPLAHAMTLATVDAGGAPDARMVLLEGFGPDGFRFFTSYESEKARQLEGAPRAALVLYWRELDRQVRIRGPVERLAEADSDDYFATRPHDAQLAAWLLRQSEPVRSREQLEERMRELEQRFAEGAVERPGHWGGYVLLPEEIEFWQGQVDRLHDRFRYAREGVGWRLERLVP